MQLCTKVCLAVVFVALISPLQAADTLLRVKKIYTGAGAPLEPGAVLIKDGKIAKVAGKIDDSAGATVVELPNVVLTPGLIDAHSTLGVVGGDCEVTVEIAPTFRAIRAIDWTSRDFREAKRTGVTTAAIFPGGDTVIGGRVAVVKTDGDDPKQRIVKDDVGLAAVLGVSPTNRNRARTRPDSIYVRQPSNRMGVIWMLRATFHKARQSKDAHYEDVLSAKMPLLAVAQVEPDIDAVLRLADEFKFKPIIFGGGEAFRAADVLAKAKVPVVVEGIGTSLRSGAEGSDPFWNHAGVLHKAGVTFAIAGGSQIEQARFAARYGLPADVALAAVTSTPASILGISDRVGTIKEGLDADLVAFEGEPLDFTSNIAWTAVNGVIPESIAKGNTK